MNKERFDRIGGVLCDVGRNLPDDITLNDLYNYHVDDGRMAGNPPCEWLEAISRLEPGDKRTITTAIGKVNRLLFKKIGTNPTLKDLRCVESEILEEGGSRWYSKLSVDSIILLSTIFGSEVQIPQLVDFEVSL